MTEPRRRFDTTSDARSVNARPAPDAGRIPAGIEKQTRASWLTTAIRNEGVLCAMSGEANEPMTDTMRLRGWMGRLFGPLLADLKFVDSASLDVLVYCADDLAVGTRGDWQLAGRNETP